jgi:hypothetical protein
MKVKAGKTRLNPFHPELHGEFRRDQWNVKKQDEALPGPLCFLPCGAQSGDRFFLDTNRQI